MDVFAEIDCLEIDVEILACRPINRVLDAGVIWQPAQNASDQCPIRGMSGPGCREGSMQRNVGLSRLLAEKRAASEPDPHGSGRM